MNYPRIYWCLMNRAAERDIDEFTEKHHVIPRSEGGSSKKTNMVRLTPREHHLAHLILIRMRKCLKYCYRHLSIREYEENKRIERVKKHIYF